MSIYPERTNRFDSRMRIALIVGVVAAVLAVVGLFVSGSPAFFQAYLLGFTFWLGVSLGLMALLHLHFLVSSRWGLTIRRIAEAGTGSLWIMALLFIPILFGLRALYPWANPEFVAEHHIMEAKTWYLNTPFFILRAVIYFAVWVVLAYFTNRQITRLRGDVEADLVLRGRLKGLGAAGLILYTLTMTFAAFDWLMSLDAEWSSSAFGLVIIVAQVMTGIGFGVLMINLLPELSLGRRWTHATTPVPFRDLGALMMTLVMGFAYLVYMQFLIHWAGNMPREVVWYIDRSEGGWGVVIALIALFQFTLPFLMLLSMRVRHNLRLLAILGGMLLFTNLLNLFWHIKPAFFPGQFAISWLDIVLPVAIGGLWLAAFFFNLARRPALFERDLVALELAEATAHEETGDMRHAH